MSGLRSTDVNNITTRTLSLLLFASAVVLAVLLFYAGAAWRARVTTGARAPRINTIVQADRGVGPDVEAGESG